MSDKNDKEKRPGMTLFAHPLTFLVTNVLMPLLATGAAAYLWWVTGDSLDGALKAKAMAVLVASALVPLSAAAVLLLRPKRMNVFLMFAYALTAFLFLYMSVPVMGDMVMKVDGWIIGPTPMLSVFAGMVPVVFAGIACIATADWRAKLAADLGMSGACLIMPPVLVFFALNTTFRFGKYLDDAHLGKFLSSVAVHLLAVGYFLLCAVFFVGLVRVIHKLFTVAVNPMNRDVRHYAGAVFFALILPLSGLALNLSIPFPADFANAWAWSLAVFTGAVMLLPARGGRIGLAFYFLKFLAGPFVLYFFVLFVPFLPLSIFAMLMAGAGFLILAPVLLMRFWTVECHEAWLRLREEGRSKKMLVAVAAAAMLVLPALFAVDVEIERCGLKALMAWHTEEDFDLPPEPMPVSQARAERIMNGVNDYTFGSEIPFLSAWRTWRVYDGMYMADKLRNELNMRVLGKKVDDPRDFREQMFNSFGSLFGANSARRSLSRGRNIWSTRPQQTKDFTVSASPCGAEGEAAYKVLVKTKAPYENREFSAALELPAGAWIDGMRLMMTNGEWKVARASERKAAEWVYNKITEQRRDPSLVTLDTPASGRIQVFPVGPAGREVELTIRLPAPASSPWIAKIDSREVANPLYPPDAAPGEIYTAEGAALSVVPESWMREHEAEALPFRTDASPEVFDVDDGALAGKMRRFLRKRSRSLGEDGCSAPSIRFSYTAGESNIVISVLSTNVLARADLDTLRREFPGIETIGDRPLDGWFLMDGEAGRKVAVPYRKGDGGAVVFARIKGAVQIGGAWAEGAKAWELENAAFLKPGLDVRRELLDLTRKCGTLTTKSAYIVVESAAQEKGLRQKEFETLHGDKSLDIDESTASSTSDAPGFLILAALMAIFLVFRRARLWYNANRA